MISKIGKGFIVFLFLIGVLTSCSLLSEKQYEEDVNLKIVKSGVKIEEVSLMRN
jgi:hypothetical protein